MGSDAHAGSDKVGGEGVHAGISLMLEEDVRGACLPLFEAGVVDVLEWSFDTGWPAERELGWAEGLLDFYGEAGRLLGHGVTFSALSGEWTARQAEWLKKMGEECRARRYRQISEHFGFMMAGSFHKGAPLGVPMTAGALRVGRDRLARMRDVSGLPVGLENLAFAFGLEDVRRQGEFLDALLEPVGGFLLLDLHNLYCQSENFGIEPGALMGSYPLARVKELHVSGGSWSEAVGGAGKVRRDTHDGEVPERVFEMLGMALERCPGVEAVILERLGGTIGSEEAAAGFRRDFMRMREIVKGGGRG
jgi:uncharacterized protein